MTTDQRLEILSSAVEFLENVKEREYEFNGEIHSSDSDSLILNIEINKKGSFNVIITAIDYPRDEPRYSYRVKADTAVNARLDENVKLKRDVNFDMFDLKNYINKIQP